MTKYFILFVFVLFFISCFKNTKPDSPSDPYPKDSAVNVIDSVIRWKSFDVDGDKIKYGINISKYRVGEKRQQIVSKSQYEQDTFVIHNIESNMGYYWYITVNDGKSFRIGQIWCFKTGNIK